MPHKWIIKDPKGRKIGTIEPKIRTHPLVIARGCLTVFAGFLALGLILRLSDWIFSRYGYQPGILGLAGGTLVTWAAMDVSVGFCVRTAKRLLGKP